MTFAVRLQSVCHGGLPTNSSTRSSHSARASQEAALLILHPWPRSVQDCERGARQVIKQRPLARWPKIASCRPAMQGRRLDGGGQLVLKAERIVG